MACAIAFPSRLGKGVSAERPSWWDRLVRRGICRFFVGWSATDATAPFSRARQLDVPQTAFHPINFAASFDGFHSNRGGDRFGLIPWSCLP